MTILYCVTNHNKVFQFLKNTLIALVVICTLFPVLLLDTLNYENIEESCDFTENTKSLLRILCQVQPNTTLKVKSLNVAVQNDKGMVALNLIWIILNINIPDSVALNIAAAVELCTNVEPSNLWSQYTNARRHLYSCLKVKLQEVSF